MLCAIALSLAYPVREYIAQRSQIAQLQKREAAARADVEDLNAQKSRLGDPDYVKGEARRRLHYCDPGEQCFVVLDGEGGASQYGGGEQEQRKAPPWYETLWGSVEAADEQP
ncbi:septum formation initiator family protein [Actinocorallia sp. API 0066]|uniref:FtsB family cell division protein n=1 Tax=Actinocorallia sp. API 0066 TaxID=2896846 RepID=UPI001E3D3BAE|nr:septum formation initiator family protein [Actinocorallia sp. API 0066]MCD0447836.1 septum formation initiator family protein [Actinocorallia sp. API 0066]